METEAPEKFYYLCTANPKAALTVVESLWEAKDMDRHPDYIRVQADGTPISNPEDSAPQRIPFQPGNTGPAEGKRPTLTIKRPVVRAAR